MGILLHLLNMTIVHNVPQLPGKAVLFTTMATLTTQMAEAIHTDMHATLDILLNADVHLLWHSARHVLRMELKIGRVQVERGKGGGAAFLSRLLVMHWLGASTFFWCYR